MKAILLTLLFLAGIGGIALVWMIVAKIGTKMLAEKEKKN